MRLRRTTRHENEVQAALWEKGQSVVQASLESDCLEVEIPCGDRDPAEQTDPRR